jgi:hypothetical protein
MRKHKDLKILTRKGGNQNKDRPLSALPRGGYPIKRGLIIARLQTLIVLLYTIIPFAKKKTVE